MPDRDSVGDSTRTGKGRHLTGVPCICGGRRHRIGTNDCIVRCGQYGSRRTRIAIDGTGVSVSRELRAYRIERVVHGDIGDRV
jgi:hypothetical protein